MVKKECNLCKTLKPLSLFYKDSSVKSRKAAICKKCKNNKTTLYRINNKDKVNAGKQRRYDPRIAKKSYLKSLYNISISQYDNMVEKQENKCAICKKEEIVIKHNKKQQLTIDHNHINGKIRGLLCSKCNLAIGLLHCDETTELLTNALEYIKQNS